VPVFGHLGAEAFEETDELGMAPRVAVARQPHHLPGGAVDGNALAPGEAAAGVESDHVGWPGRRRDLAAETAPSPDFLGSSGWASGGSTRGSTVPLSCAAAPLAAASNRTIARLETGVRIDSFCMRIGGRVWSKKSGSAKDFRIGEPVRDRCRCPCECATLRRS